MNRILLSIFSLIATGYFAGSQIRYDLNFMLDGKLRNAVISHPGKPMPIGGYPLVFMLHGTSGDGEKFYNISGWKELGVRENFITVFPSSLTWCFVDDGKEEWNSRWVNGGVTEFPCSGQPQKYIDDTKFLKHLVKLISDTLPINSKMVFLSGFSNGSNEMHKLAIEAGDVFKALAGTSGLLSSSDSAKPVSRVPVWVMVGTKDDRWTTPFMRDELPFNDTILLLNHKPIHRMLACQGLTQDYNTMEKGSVKTYQFNTSMNGEVSAPYWFSIVDEMLHQYPNGSNYPMSCPEIFWDFFKNSTTTSLNTVKFSDHISVYPIPAKDYLAIQLDKNIKEVKIEVYSLTGQVLMREETNTINNVKLEISSLLSGSYLLRISNKYYVEIIKFQVLK